MKNSAFDAEVLRGSYSYTFNLPMTDLNRKYFGFPEQIGSNAAIITDYDNFILKSGLVQFLVRLRVQSISLTAISVNVFSGSAAYSSLLRNTFLKDLNNLGSYTVPADVYYLCRSAWETAPNDQVVVILDMNGDQYVHGYGPCLNMPREKVIWYLCQRLNRRTKKYPANWNNATNYTIREWVIAGGNLYRALAANTNVNPVGNPATWSLIGDNADYEELRNSTQYSGWWEYDVAADPQSYTALPFMGYSFIFDQELTDTFPPDPGVIADDFTSDNLATNSTADVNRVAAVLKHMYEVAHGDVLTGEYKFFPVRDEKFFSDQFYNNAINYWRFGGFVNERFDGMILNTALGGKVVENACVPFLRVIWLLNKVHEAFGLTVEDYSVFTNNFLKNLVAYSNYSNENATSFNHVFQRNLFVPDCSVADFINGFRAYFFIGCWFDFFSNTVVWKPLKDVIVDYANAVDITDLVPNPGELSFDENDGYVLAYGHDSSDAVSGDQIKDLEQDKDIIIISPVANVTALPSGVGYKRVAYVQNIQRYYISYQKSDGTFGWKDYSGYLPDFKIDGGETVYQPKAAPLMDWIGSDDRDTLSQDIPAYDTANDPYYRVGSYVKHGSIVKRMNNRYYGTTPPYSAITNTLYWQPISSYAWRVPYAGMLGKSRQYEQRQECKFRMISYAGVRQNPLTSEPTDKYPLATNDLYDLTGEIWTGEPGGSLRWEGTYGVYQQWAKPWMDFLKRARTVKLEIVVDEILIQKLKPWKLVKIRNHYFAWSELVASLPLDSGKAKLTLHLVKSV
jgi:hypothetical protein